MKKIIAIAAVAATMVGVSSAAHATTSLFDIIRQANNGSISGSSAAILGYSTGWNLGSAAKHAENTAKVHRFAGDAYTRATGIALYGGVGRASRNLAAALDAQGAEIDLLDAEMRRFRSYHGILDGAFRAEGISGTPSSVADVQARLQAYQRADNAAAIASARAAALAAGPASNARGASYDQSGGNYEVSGGVGELGELVVNAASSGAYQINPDGTPVTTFTTPDGRTLRFSTYDDWSYADQDAAWDAGFRDRGIGDALEEVIEDALESAFDAGYDEGYADGYADGFADGVASVR